MTNTEIKKIYDRYISEEIPSDFKLDKGILYKSPVKDVLVGFCFEKSGFNKECVYVSVFAQPLYIESDCIVLTFGHRLKNKKNGELWHLKNNPNIDKVVKDLVALMEKEIQDFFPKVQTANDFFKYYKDKKVKNIRIKEALTYSAIYSERKESKELLESFINELKNEDLEIGWINSVLQNATNMKELLQSGVGVSTLFDKNIELTKTHLKVA